MAANPKLCSICELRNMSRPSTDWCSECDQAFCAECKEFHALSRSSQNHVTLPIDDYLSLSSSISAIISLCPDHNEKYQMLCEIHDELICPMCIEKHTQCKSVMPLGKITQNIKRSGSFYETKQSLLDIEDNITKMEKCLQENIEELKSQEESALGKVKTIRTKINDHLDNLEQTLVQELTEEGEKARNEIQTNVKSLQDMKSQISKSLKCMEDLNKFASNLQAFFGMRQVSSEVISAESVLKHIVKEGLNKVQLKCCVDEKVTNILRDIVRFGNLQMERKCSEYTFVRTKDRQAQIVEPDFRTINDMKVKLVKKINTKASAVRGCAVLPGGEMVLTDDAANNERILVFDSGARESFEIPMKHCYAVDVTCMDCTTVALTSSKFGFKPDKPFGMNSLQGINIVDVTTRKISKFIPIRNKCHGITYHNGSLLCSVVEKGIQMVVPDTGKCTTIIQSNLPVWTYITSFKDKIFYSNGDTHTITCKTIESNTVWTFCNEAVLKNPLGISVDNLGNVYVASCSDSSVVVLSPDGKYSRRLLSKEDGLEYPRALHYDRIRNRLLIVNKKDTAFLFGISFET